VPREKEFAHVALAGLQSLRKEAIRHDHNTTAKVLNACLLDVCKSLVVEGYNGDHGAVISDEDFVQAAKFLSLYSEISDRKLKKDILKVLKYTESFGQC
jgi:hypothetical protein